MITAINTGMVTESDFVKAGGAVALTAPLNRAGCNAAEGQRRKAKWMVGFD